MRAEPGALPLPPAPVVRVLDLLDSLTITGSGKKRVATLNGIASAATMELFTDGVSRGSKPAAGAVANWSVPIPAAATAPCAWPVNQSGVQCKGLLVLPNAGKSAAACAAAACAEGAQVWQYAAARAENEACWAGTPNSLPCPPPVTGEPWVGGGAPTPPPPVQNATLIARDAGGSVVGVHTVLAPRGSAVGALALTLDVPSPATGTGARLVLDGADVALVRLSALDVDGGMIVSGAPLNVTFSVVSGPGRLAGVGNGDPTSHAQPNGGTVATFGGLARALIVITVDCVSPGRDLVRAVDTDGGEGRVVVVAEGTPCPVEDIVVAVDSDGLARATVRISVSGDAAADGVLAAAAGAVGKGAVDYVASFVG